MVRPTGPRWTLGAWRGLLPAVFAALAVLGLGRMTPAAADPAASEWFVTEQGSVRLIAAAPQTGAADTRRLGLEFRLAPGWKIYWRAPGDAGLPRAWIGRDRAIWQRRRSRGLRHSVSLPMGWRRSATRTPSSCRSARGSSGKTHRSPCVPHSSI